VLLAVLASSWPSLISAAIVLLIFAALTALVRPLVMVGLLRPAVARSLSGR